MVPENDVVVEIRWRIEEREGKYRLIRSAPDDLGRELGPMTLDEAHDVIRHSWAATIEALHRLYFSCHDDFRAFRDR
jgi:hypothetical protein